MRIGRAGTAAALLRAAVILVVVATVLVLFGWEAGLAYPTLWLTGIAVSIVYVVIARRTHTLVITDEALIVEAPKGTTRYAWPDLLEVGWARGYWPIHWPGLVVRPKGGPWDTPGPYAPTKVATLAVFGRSAHRQAQDALQDACRRHAVTFAEDGSRMGPTPPNPGVAPKP